MSSDMTRRGVVPPVHQPVGDTRFLSYWMSTVSIILDVDGALPRRNSGPTGVLAHVSHSMGTAVSVHVNGVISHLPLQGWWQHIRERQYNANDA